MMTNTAQKPRAIVFGTGLTFRFYKEMIYGDFDVVALMSNSAGNTGKRVDGLAVYGVDMLPKLEYDVILIAANYTNSHAIRRQLTDLGICPSKLRFYGNTGTYPYRIPWDFFRTDLCEEDKKRLFSENVERVVLELNSRCNRRCWFCPNSIVDRHSQNLEMEDALFDKVVGELASIQYRYDLSLCYFNEPMCSAKIYDRITALRSALPEAYIYTFSNGDLLDRDALARLASAGCDLLRIDTYTNDRPGEHSWDKALAAAERLIRRLELRMHSHITEAREEMPLIIAKGRVGNMTVEVLAQDFSATAGNRAESLPDSLPIPRIEAHHRPCIKNFISFHIAYNGKVYPCPNMHTDVEQHQQYCVGDLNRESMFDVFTGKALNEFRENNFFHRDTLPCRSCKWDFDQFIENQYDRPFRDRPGSCTE